MTTSLRRSGARPHSVLAAAALALLLGAGLAACGSQDSDSGSDTASDPQSSSTPTQTPKQTPPSSTPSDGTGSTSGESLPVTGDAGVTEATLISGTDAGGTASTMATVLDGDQARTDFATQFKADFATTLLSEMDSQQPAAGATLYGAVAAVGCDAPESIRIDAGEAGFQITPMLPKEKVQCFAPVTFVVLFSVPDA